MLKAVTRISSSHGFSSRSADGSSASRAWARDKPRSLKLHIINAGNASLRRRWRTSRPRSRLETEKLFDGIENADFIRLFYGF